MGTEAIMEEDLQRNTNHLLHRLGLTANYRGYFYVSYGIMLCAKEQERLLLVTKRLYPEVAKRYGTNWKAVERSIRTASGVIWRGNRLLLEEIAGNPGGGGPGKGPSAGASGGMTAPSGPHLHPGRRDRPGCMIPAGPRRSVIRRAGPCGAQTGSSTAKP